MDNEDSDISEEALAEKIVYYHDVLGYGFRRITDKLLEEYGIEIGKDTVFRRYHKYKKTETVAFAERDEELAELDELEREAQKKAETARKKEERRRRIAALLVQEADASFERRQELFQNKKALLEFSEKVLLVINPTLWLRLNKFCETKKLDLADTIHEASGSQIDFEEARMQALKEDDDYFLDEYLCFCLDDWLSEKEKQQQEDDKPNIIIDVVETEGIVHPPVPTEYDSW